MNPWCPQGRPCRSPWGSSRSAAASAGSGPYSDWATSRRWAGLSPAVASWKARTSGQDASPRRSAPSTRCARPTGAEAALTRVRASPTPNPAASSSSAAASERAAEATVACCVFVSSIPARSRSSRTRSWTRASRARAAVISSASATARLAATDRSARTVSSTSVSPAHAPCVSAAVTLLTSPPADGLSPFLPGWRPEPRLGHLCEETSPADRPVENGQGPCGDVDTPMVRDIAAGQAFDTQPIPAQH